MQALANLQATLELDDAPSVPDEVKATVVAYNKDDCLSASGLRQWLETLRGGLVAAGTDVPRPQPGEPEPNEKITDWQIKIATLVDKLTADVPVDPEERDEEQQARWILANVPRLAPQGGQGCMVGVFPARRPFGGGPP